MKNWKRALSCFCLLILLLGVLYYLLIFKPSEIEKRKHLHAVTKKEEVWNAKLEHAMMLSYQHHYEDAEQEFRFMLKQDPESITVKENLAFILFYQKKDQEALNLLEQIPTNKRNWKMNLLLADIYLSLKDYNKAEILYIDYLQNFPQDQTVQLKLAKLFAWQKKYEQSVEIFQKLLSENPQNLQLRRHYALVLMWMGNFKDSALEMQKTLSNEQPETENFSPQDTKEFNQEKIS
ncbi:MAG: tetratricopeptide repeat protein [Parachlamydiaceae bacterium]|nr:tetratricopeptide repeat protein [Parachlamydiaceae bacterium]